MRDRSPRAASFVLLAVLATLGVAPRAIAAPPACDTSWKNASNGSWGNAANWTSGVPDPSSKQKDDACIDLPGTYTVTLTGQRGAGTLHLGTTSGAQTLLIDGAAAPASLTLTGAAALTTSGVVALGGQTMDDAVVAATSFTNDGTLRTPAGQHGRVTAPFTNHGTIDAVGAMAIGQAGSSLTSDGTLRVQNALTFGGATLTLSGGSFGGGGELRAPAVSTFSHTGGTAADAFAIVISHDATLSLAAAGPLRVRLDGCHCSLSGSIAAGNTVEITSATSATSLFSSSSWVNSGTIVLGDAADTASSSLGVIFGSVYNLGTLEARGPATFPAAVYGTLDNRGLLAGTMTVEGDLLNSGAVGPGPLSPPPVGTIDVTGQFTQSATGVLDVDLVRSGGVDRSDRVMAAGGSTVGGTLHVDNLLPDVPADLDLTIVASPSSGTFGTTQGLRTGNRALDVVYGSGVHLVAVPSADLSIALTSSPDPVTIGDEVTYMAVVSNAGPDPAGGVVAKVALTGAVAFVSATPGCSGSMQVTCDLGTIAPGDHATVHVVARTWRTGTFQAGASVEGNVADPDTADHADQASTTVQRNAQGCTFLGTAGADTLDGTAGADVLCGAGGDDTLKGLEGNDRLLGGAGDDSLSGGPGDDRLAGGMDDDSYAGGTGNDLATFGRSATAVRVDLGAGTASGDGTDALAGIERATGSRFADVLRGSAAADVLSGGAGDDELFGLGGDDLLKGSAGDDDLDGGPGIDTCRQGTGTGSRLHCE